MVDYKKLHEQKQTVEDYIRIISSRDDINVQYVQKKNETDCNTTIWISPDFDKYGLEFVTAIAMHEASHIVYTDTELINSIKDIDESFFSIGVSKNYSIEELREFHFNIFNLLEDMRIDMLTYDDSVGYRKYYLRMYNYFWQESELKNAIHDEKFMKEDIRSYIVHLALMGSENFNKNAVKKISEIHDFVFSKLALSSTCEDVLEMANHVYTLIESSLDKKENDEEEASKKNDKDSDTKSEELSEGLKKALEEYQSFLSSSFFEDTATEQDMKIAEDNSNFEAVKSLQFKDGEADPIVVTEFETSHISNPLFANLFNNERDIELHTSSTLHIRKGKAFQNELDYLRKESTKINRRKKRGNIDSLMLCEIGYNPDIFYTEIKNISDKVLIHISLDCSSSMLQSRLFDNAVNTVSFLVGLFENEPNIRLQVSLRSVVAHSGSISTTPIIYPLLYIIYDSSKDSVEDFVTRIVHVHPHSSTPEGLLYDSIKEILSYDSSHQIFVNICDGMPWFKGIEIEYIGPVAVKHTADKFNNLKLNGLECLSFFVYTENISDTIRTQFASIFKSSAHFIRNTEFNAIVTKLNELLTVDR